MVLLLFIAHYKVMEHFAIICESEFESSAMAEGTNYTGDLPRYVLGPLFDKLTDKCY